MRRLPSKQIESVLLLPAPKRYEHFIKQVVDWEEAWGLYSDGWALAGADEGEKVFPLWPAKEYAALCATGQWSTYSPKAIPLDDVLEALLPRLDSDRVLVGVFYTPADTGITVAARQLLEELRAEAARYE
jgi:hypothetical protein